MSTIADCVYKTIIIPLARQLIHQIIRATTASIINWINGGNGTGQPSFVLNLSLHLQAVSDAVVLPFIGQLQRVLNPAFAAGIASSILTKYALGTSVGGFLASSQGTLGRYSPNQTAFVAGDYRQGGIPAWFALTTQDNNNPYMVAAAAASKGDSLVNQAITNRRQDLVQGRGFLSWCGPSTTGGSGSSITPTAACKNADGSDGNVKTPGVVIQDYVKDALGSDMASLVNPTDIDSAIAAIFGAALQQTMNSIFGGGGLFGASQPSSIRPTAITTAIQTTAVGNATVIVDVNAIAAAATARLQAYTLAWNTIGSAAGTAQTQLTSLKFTCTAQASAADTGLASVNTVLAQVQTALNAVSGTQALILQVQQDAQDTTAAGTAKLNTDLAALAAAPPTNADVSSAQVNAATTGAATASPTGSLTVSGGTLVDQMNLLNFNATALITDPVACPVT
ncbi:hypothetical protein A2950_01200 [Candidatus Kaiserbacteria bacterium RIFCSPLOWO2_01_FULL_55_19]|uniref:Uncharacterized protein n=1 Tax=Candidatus Kaiserbacteria bacterium RIFCSPLOWO2_01_FULL_55_19 TaxID=1798516 RepID=A0A1F6ERW0_9BACT|nr:MAG: hypothetical protein A2950_01200 [Candidatus Kaiserbacteria bacterium RIFCSPLOWO2_01_FULL_55_19]